MLYAWFIDTGYSMINKSAFFFISYTVTFVVYKAYFKSWLSKSETENYWLVFALILSGSYRFK